MTNMLILAGASIMLLLCAGILVGTGIWAKRQINSYKHIALYLKSELDSSEVKENYYELILEAILMLMRDLVQDATDTAQTQTNIYRLLNTISALENRSDLKNVYIRVDRAIKQDMMTLESALCEVMRRYYSYDVSQQALTRLIDRILYTLVEEYDSAKNGSSKTFHLMVDKVKACGITIRKPASHQAYKVKMPEPESDLWDGSTPARAKFLQAAMDMNIDWKTIAPELVDQSEESEKETTETVDHSGATVIHVGSNDS